MKLHISALTAVVTLSTAGTAMSQATLEVPDGFERVQVTAAGVSHMSIFPLDTARRVGLCRAGRPTPVNGPDAHAAVRQNVDAARRLLREAT